VDDNWWEYSLDEDVRRKVADCELKPPFVHVNPATEGKRHSLTYDRYERLDVILSAQFPSSRVPDERIFVVVHQLFELTFKQTLFDCTIISDTLRHLETLDDVTFLKYCRASTTDPDPFWRPALTAAARLAYSAETMCPDVMRYLQPVRFNVDEFGYFRPFLSPASGFQSAQFRILQRALAKAPLLALPVFPAREFARHYRGEGDDRLLPVEDQLLLASHEELANAREKRSALATAMDDMAHGVLNRLAEIEGTPSRSITLIGEHWATFTTDELSHLLEEHLARLRAKNSEEYDRVAPITKQLLQDFGSAAATIAERENIRRRKLSGACGAAVSLKREHGKSALCAILQRIADADYMLHMAGEEPDRPGRAFVRQHHAVAFATIKQLQKRAAATGAEDVPSGTGGGGYEYLKFAMTTLYPHFPAVIAFLEATEEPDAHA